MLKRFIKVLYVFSLLLILGAVIGMVVWSINNPNDIFDLFEFILVMIISSLPLIVVLILKYVIYGSIK